LSGAGFEGQDGSRRPLYGREELHRLINPRTVAIVGASDAPGSFGERTLSNMSSFAGEVYAVNPKYQTVLNRRCVPSIAELPEAPDCIVLCVGRPLVAKMIEQAAQVGAGGAVVYASGFTETGLAERIEEQSRLAELARSNSIRLAGPNCVGLANTRSRAGLNFMPDYGRMGHRRGPIGIVSQSGALGYTILQGMERGVGFSHYLAAGNSCDVDVCDYVSYLAEDDDTRAIVCLFEGVRDGGRFLEAARKAREVGKPLIIYKAGNSEASKQAALSHTGTMVGSSAAYTAAFKEVGAIATDDLEAVLEFAGLFAKSKAPAAGRGVGVLATSGGAAVISADKAEQHEVPLPALDARTESILAGVVPDFGSVANPADLTAEVLKTSASFGHCLDAFLADPSFSALVLPMVFAHSSSSGARAPAVIEASRRTDRPLAIVWMNEWYQGPGSELYDADTRVAIFRSMDRCFAALRAWFDWHDYHPQVRTAETRHSHPEAESSARAIIKRYSGLGHALSEIDSKQILQAYGVLIPAEELAESPQAAQQAAARIGLPVVVKISSPDILHKTEVGGIRLGLNTAEAVRDATTDVLASAARHAPNARIEGVSIQRMAPPGVEMVVGVKRDRQFGPLIAVGLGGVMVELLKDTAVRLAPVSKETAREMLETLKGYKLLTGYRGGPGANIDLLVDTICRLSQLAHDLQDVIEEVDVNPVIVSPFEAVAADALIIVDNDREVLDARQKH